MARTKKSVSLYHELIGLCKNVMNDKPGAQEAFDSFVKEKVEIKSYIPIMEKYTLVKKIVAYLDALDLSHLDNIMVSVEKEYITLFYILLAYTNLKFDDKDMSFYNYDAIVCSGFESIVFAKCANDMSRINRMVDDCISINVIKYLNDSVTSLDDGSVKENIEKFQELVKDPQVLNDMVKIAQYNDPALANGLRIIGTIQEEKAAK